MHDRGVVHRDMNPTNVFLVDPETNFIKILDFNVSKLIENNRFNRKTSFDEAAEEIK